MPRRWNLNRPIVDCKVYTNDPYTLNFKYEYTRQPREGSETIHTGFGGSLKNWASRHRPHYSKMLCVTVQVTMRRVTIKAVINLPPPKSGKKKRIRVFDYTISASGREYPLRLWIRTSQGQRLDGDDSESEAHSAKYYFRASWEYARLLVDTFYTMEPW
ncbi:hypothetical protein ACHAPT_002319 [Fusarium lateritium]